MLAVGHDAERAQRLVHVRLHLAPERAEAGVLAVEVVHHHDRGLRRARDIVEIVEPLLHVAGFAERHLVLGLEGHGLGEADDRRQVGEGAVQVLDGVAVAAPLGRDHLDQIAHRRGIDRAQEFELARVTSVMLGSLVADRGGGVAVDAALAAAFEPGGFGGGFLA